MPTEVDICNMALGEISDDVITALSDSNEAGRRCTLLYPQARDEVLALHPWRFAMGRTTLVRNGATLDISSETGAPQSLSLSPDGKRLYVLGGTSVYQYTLSTPWDITSGVSADKSFDFATEELTPTGIAFNPTGTKMYMVGTTDKLVEQYSLATPWDVSTAVVDAVTLDVSTEDTAPQSLTFGSSGLKLYVVGDTNNSVFEYTLTTAYDLSTATYSTNTVSVAVQDTAPRDVRFKSDGLSMYMIGSQSDAVHQYTLSTAWDVNTASTDSVDFLITDDDTDPASMFFNPDGTRLLVLGGENDKVYNFGLGISGDLSTASRTIDDFGYPYKSSVPEDIIRPHEFYHGSTVVEPNWELEQGFILSDESTVDLRYIKRVTNTARFNALFVKTVYLNLAALLAIAIKGDRALKKELILDRDAVIREAELMDARVGNPAEYVADEGWTDREGGFQ